MYIFMKRIGLLFFVCLMFAACSAEQKLTVTVTNNSAQNRTGELVEFPWEQITQKIKLTDGAQLIVIDETGAQLPYQLVYNGGKEVESLLFPAAVAAGKKADYTFKTGTPEVFPANVYGRFVPERKDDFAWENDKVAFRMYGPALQATGELSNGIDIWVKSTNALVIDKWYKNDLSGVASYHEDHGEGMDFYKVGRTLGAGALAPYVNDSLWLGTNFVKYEVLDNGPLRITFRLTYAPFDVDGKPVVETRTISLDANNQLSKITEKFEMDAPSMLVASGITLRKEEAKITDFSAELGYAAYADPDVKGKGVIYTGLVSPAAFKDVKIASDHLLALNEYTKGTGYVYYAGGGWSKSGFATPADWFEYVKDFALRVQQPLSVAIK